MKCWMLGFVAYACAGCTMMSLERHTVAQTDSAIDLRYREIMDNLALIAADPATLPNFVTIFSGTVSVQDTGQMVATPTWPFRAGMVTASPSLNRQISQNWVLDPVIIPERLEAIRAALQWAVGGSESVDQDSIPLLLGPQQAQPGTQRHFDVADKLLNMPKDWLGRGRRKDVPACARYKAHCGDVWVWVTPDGMKGLSDLTIVVQHIARVPINSPTLINPPPSYSSIVLKTADSQNPGSRIGVTAQVVVDQSGRLYTDPFIPTRNDNAGADANIRSIITAASITTVPH
jgi:hypothetical protein